MTTTKDGVKQSRVRETAKWGGLALCVLILLFFGVCVLWRQLTIAAWGYSEIGLRRGAIVAISSHANDWPSITYGSHGPPYYSIDQWADDWAADSLWPMIGQREEAHWIIIPLWIPFAIVSAATLWFWRDERKWIIATLVIFVACLVGTRIFARYCYTWTGFPDNFRAENVLLPELLHFRYGDRIWRDGETACIFFSACAVYAIPPFVGLALARRKWLALVVVFASVINAVMAISDSWERWASYVEVFRLPSSGGSKVFELARRDIQWVVSLTLGALLAGWLIRWVVERYRPSRGCCRACGYDLRVQSALGIDRCPECGKEIKSSNPERESLAS